MTMFKYLLPAMVVLLALFFLFAGMPGPDDVIWMNQVWDYTHRNDGELTYESEAGSLKIRVHGVGSYTLSFQGQEYLVAMGSDQITILFPDGRELMGAIVGSGKNRGVDGIDPVSPAELPIFELALEADRVARPDTTRLVIGILVMVYGIFNVINPKGFVRVTMAFRRWMIGKTKPTDFNIKSSRIMGGFFVVAGWFIILMSVWRVG